MSEQLKDTIKWHSSEDVFPKTKKFKKLVEKEKAKLKEK